MSGSWITLLDTYKLNREPLNNLPMETQRVFTPYKHLLPFQLSFVVLPDYKDKLIASMPTGTGKSFTAIMRAEQLGYNKLLIVGPQRLKKNWQTECEEIDLNVLTYWGTPKQRAKLREKFPEYSIFYVNPEQLEEFWRFNPGIDFVIIDEIHIVCNSTTKSYKSLNSIIQTIDRRVGLSATPMRLNMGNLWGVLNLIDPDIAGDKAVFLSEFEEVVTTIPIRIAGGRVWHKPLKVRSKNESQLRERLSSIMYRIKKSDVVDFKDNVDLVQVDISVRQRRLYEECLKGIQLELSSGTLDVRHALARATRLLQITEGLFNLDSVYKDSGKLDYLKEALKENIDAGIKTVVWSRFEPITREIYNLFPKHTVVYSGRTPDASRNMAVWSFNGCKTDENKREAAAYKLRHPEFIFDPGDALIFAGTHSLQGGMGINLESAHTVYFTSFDWNPDTIFQARDRVSRLTQTEDTQTYFLLADHTIERKVLHKILQSKEATSRILDGVGSAETDLARELVSLIWSN